MWQLGSLSTGKQLAVTKLQLVGHSLDFSVLRLLYIWQSLNRPDSLTEELPGSLPLDALHMGDNKLLPFYSVGVLPAGKSACYRGTPS